jgi:hypothetical protein
MSTAQLAGARPPALQAQRQRHVGSAGTRLLPLLLARPSLAAARGRPALVAAAASQPRGSGGRALPPAAGGERAPPLLASSQPQAAAPSEQQQQRRPDERWMPASWLSGCQGAGTMLLSLGAVSGGGLLGG